MRRELGVALTIIALVMGVLVGYGVWGTDVGAITALELQLERLAHENAELKTQLQARGAPPPQTPGAVAPAPPGFAGK